VMCDSIASGGICSSIAFVKALSPPPKLTALPR